MYYGFWSAVAGLIGVIIGLVILWVLFTTPLGIVAILLIGLALVVSRLFKTPKG